MIENLKYTITRKWQTFLYNYKWSDYVQILNGPYAKLALAIPIFGYLVLFNDYIVDNLSFSEIADSEELWLNSTNRLRFVYFGLIFLATANVIYYFKRAWVLRLGKTEKEFLEYGLTYFTSSDFLHFHQKIRDGHYTSNGKYYDSEWDGFWAMAVGEEGIENNRPGDWKMAKNKYENLLLSILKETYFSSCVDRKIYLTIALVFALVGYLLIIIPSIELFLRILMATFF